MMPETTYPKLQLGFGGTPESPTDVEIAAPDIAHHTAIVAQSGAGKSFLLGRLIEEIILRTRSRVLILDTNSDFIHVKQTSAQPWDAAPSDKWPRRTTADYETQEDFRLHWEKVHIAHLMDNGRVPWHRLECEYQAAALGIDATTEASAYHWLARTDEWMQRRTHGGRKAEYTPAGHADFVRECVQMRRNRGAKPALSTSDIADWGHLFEGEPSLDQDAAGELAALLADLDPSACPRVWNALYSVSAWQHVWGPKSDEEADLHDLIARKDLRLGVVDLCLSAATAGDQSPIRMLETMRSGMVLALYALNAAWQVARKSWRDDIETQHAKRVPFFVVIDEAHNFAPERPGSALAALVSGLISQIASEGRKYGLFLILATQRPTKVASGVLAECENACLMRLQSPAEHKAAFDVWGSSLQEVASSAAYDKGDGLLLGRWAPSPTEFHAAYRRTEEGGADLDPDHWARESW